MAHELVLMGAANRRRRSGGIRAGQFVKKGTKLPKGLKKVSVRTPTGTRYQAVETGRRGRSVGKALDINPYFTASPLSGWAPVDGPCPPGKGGRRLRKVNYRFARPTGRPISKAPSRRKYHDLEENQCVTPATYARMKEAGLTAGGETEWKDVFLISPGRNRRPSEKTLKSREYRARRGMKKRRKATASKKKASPKKKVSPKKKASAKKRKIQGVSLGRIRTIRTPSGPRYFDTRTNRFVKASSVRGRKKRRKSKVAGTASSRKAAIGRKRRKSKTKSRRRMYGKGRSMGRRHSRSRARRRSSSRRTRRRRSMRGVRMGQTLPQMLQIVIGSAIGSGVSTFLSAFLARRSRDYYSGDLWGRVGAAGLAWWYYMSQRGKGRRNEYYALGAAIGTLPNLVEVVFTGLAERLADKAMNVFPPAHFYAGYGQPYPYLGPAPIDQSMAGLGLPAYKPGTYKARYYPEMYYPVPGTLSGRRYPEMYYPVPGTMSGLGQPRAFDSGRDTITSMETGPQNVYVGNLRRMAGMASMGRGEAALARLPFIS